MDKIHGGRTTIRHAIEEKRSHYRMSLGDIIQVSNDFYMVDKVGVKKIKVID